YPFQSGTPRRSPCVARQIVRTLTYQVPRWNWSTSQGRVLPRPIAVPETSRCLGFALRPQDAVTTPAWKLALTITDPAHMKQDPGEQRNRKLLLNRVTCAFARSAHCWLSHPSTVACS